MDTPEPDGRPAANRFHMSLDELEKGVHVPVEDQVASVPDDRLPASALWDPELQQLRLAGGA